MIGVCRGKLSEGIDFCGGRASRAVIICGIPYASVNEPKIMLKKYSVEMKYHFDLNNNNHKSLLSGQDWYRQEA